MGRLTGWVIRAELYELPGARTMKGMSDPTPMALVHLFKPTKVKVGRKTVVKPLAVYTSGMPLERGDWEVLRDTYREAGAEIEELPRRGLRW